MTSQETITSALAITQSRIETLSDDVRDFRDTSTMHDFYFGYVRSGFTQLVSFPFHSRVISGVLEVDGTLSHYTGALPMVGVLEEVEASTDATTVYDKYVPWISPLTDDNEASHGYASQTYLEHMGYEGTKGLGFNRATPGIVAVHPAQPPLILMKDSGDLILDEQIDFIQETLSLLSDVKVCVYGLSQLAVLYKGSTKLFKKD